MALAKKRKRWGDRHHYAFVDLLRILLGIFLFLKGFAFMQNLSYLQWVLENEVALNLSSGIIQVLMYYVAFIHMAGGLLIMLGLITRLASILQLPVVLAAVFTIGIFKSPLNSDLWLSIFTAVLLFMFTIIGSGTFSLDNYLDDQTLN
jgi:putative oxidoreductase